MLDGSPFRFVTCELHFARIPREYWEHRILMSKAMGCNVISAYIFWNYHEYLKYILIINKGRYREFLIFLRIIGI